MDSKKALVKEVRLSENKKGKDENKPKSGHIKIVIIIMTFALKWYLLPWDARSNATPENKPRQEEKIKDKATETSLYENEINAGRSIAKERNRVDRPKTHSKVEIIF